MERTRQHGDKNSVKHALDETFLMPALNETYTISAEQSVRKSNDSGNQSSVPASLETSTAGSSESLSPEDYSSACSELSWLEEREPTSEEDEGLPERDDEILVDEGWKKLPSLIDEGGNFKYITSLPRHREFELNERHELMDLKTQIDSLRQTFETVIPTTILKHPEVVSSELKVSHAIKAVGGAKTLKDLYVKLTNMGDMKLLHTPSEEPTEDQSDKAQAPVRAEALPKQFPESATMANRKSPKKVTVFQFGMQSKSTQKRTLSQNKLPRLPKQGEVVYSNDGSPIVRHEIPSTIFEPGKSYQVVHGGAAPPHPPTKPRIRHLPPKPPTKNSGHLSKRN